MSDPADKLLANAVPLVGGLLWLFAPGKILPTLGKLVFAAGCRSLRVAPPVRWLVYLAAAIDPEAFLRPRWSPPRE